MSKAIPAQIGDYTEWVLKFEGGQDGERKWHKHGRGRNQITETLNTEEGAYRYETARLYIKRKRGRDQLVAEVILGRKWSIILTHA